MFFSLALVNFGLKRFFGKEIVDMDINLFMVGGRALPSPLLLAITNTSVLRAKMLLFPRTQKTFVYRNVEVHNDLIVVTTAIGFSAALL